MSRNLAKTKNLIIKLKCFNIRCETCPKAYKSRNARDLHIKNHPVQKIKKVTVRVKNLRIGRLQLDGLKVKVDGQRSKHKIENSMEVKTENVETRDV